MLYSPQSIYFKSIIPISVCGQESHPHEYLDEIMLLFQIKMNKAGGFVRNTTFCKRRYLPMGKIEN